MKRPSTGLSFEAALERWSSPEDYAAMLELEDQRVAAEVSAIFIVPGESDPRLDEYLRRRRVVAAALFGQLRRGELLSSATESKPDPIDPRFPVHPSIYDGDRLDYCLYSQRIVGNGVDLHNVEVFTPDAVPTNLTRRPHWFLELTAPEQAVVTAPAQREAGMAAPEPQAFRHDARYRHVWLGEQEFCLSEMQARVVQALHVAVLSGQPWMHLDELREAVGFESEKLSHLFRSLKEPSWRDLLRSDQRGFYRLNL